MNGSCEDMPLRSSCCIDTSGSINISRLTALQTHGLATRWTERTNRQRVFNRIA